ncbi:MAG: hypothetical protein BWX88_05123 [Planctomycetes bacterium ADurb.Bin126]|nr:MAG: hypothetical protein BWX88_05123 [Planctomycetes bacterium ADurb.Bin126]HOD84911.1 hypothetical protein [Phycisphaerae bacterium]
MDEGRSSQLWDHTASLMALLVNLKRTKRSQKLARPSEFHPHLRAAEGGLDIASTEGRTKFREAFAGGKRRTYKASDMKTATETQRTQR